MTQAHPRDSHYVPIEDRWLGLDKRAFPYAIVMIVVIAVLAYVVPAIDDAVEWDDATQAGDVIDLGGGVTFVPPVGWLLEEGIRTSDEPATPVDPNSSRAELVNGGVSVSVLSSSWEGTADELMDQANTLRENTTVDQPFKVTGSRSTVTTSSGVSGVSETFTSASGSGKAFAFVLPPVGDGDQVGVLVAATGSGDNLAHYTDAIDAMVSTLTRTETAS